MYLAVDSGGTSTRAAVVDRHGRCWGYGRADSGNPTSAGIAAAVKAVTTATEQALPRGRLAVDALPLGVIVMAGERSALFAEQVSAGVAALGVGRLILQPDLLGIFHSGTHEQHGFALIAGTGTVAAQVVEGRLERVSGGRGWLLGDAGGGFWIGRRVARAVVADLDAQGPPTALTGLVLDQLGLVDPRGSVSERQLVLRQLVSVLYSWRPVQLSTFAPLAFAVPDDPVALAILRRAAVAVSDLVSAVRDPGQSGVLVGGGSVLVRGLLGAPPAVRERLSLPPIGAGLVPVSDGVVGAAVLALREGGTEVDETLRRRIGAEVAQRAGQA